MKHSLLRQFIRETVKKELTTEKIEDYQRGDTVHHSKNNEIGTVLKQYGKRVHVRFSKSGEKTVNHDEIRKIDESVNEGKKRFKQQDRVGSSKYTISFHDGKKKHKDGSDFFDIKIFKNKPDLEKFRQDLSKQGYIEESVNENTDYKPTLRRDKSNPNFIYITINYPTGSSGSVLSVGGKDTMSGNERKSGSKKSLKIGNEIAKKLKSKYNIEDITVTDGKNGKIVVFAVSDDFINTNDSKLKSVIREDIKKDILNFLIQKSKVIKESVNEKTRRQLVDPETEMLVVKNRKVITIDKKDWNKYKKQGYEVAESVNEEDYDRERDARAMGYRNAKEADKDNWGRPKNNKKKPAKEGNAFGAAVTAAKEKGEDEFEVDGKTYPVKESFEIMESIKVSGYYKKEPRIISANKLNRNSSLEQLIHAYIEAVEILDKEDFGSTPYDFATGDLDYLGSILKKRGVSVKELNKLADKFEKDGKYPIVKEPKNESITKSLKEDFSSLREMIRDIILNETKYDLMFGKLGNGITVSNKKETDPRTKDYKFIAHISNNGKIEWKDKDAQRDSKVRREVEKHAKKMNENRNPKEETKFYNSLKPGDSVKYYGPEKNGFKRGDTYKVDNVKSSSTFDRTVVITNGSKKLIVKGHGSVKPVNESDCGCGNTSIVEGNAFGMAVTAAKKAGKKEFEFNGKTYKVKKGSYEKNEEAKKESVTESTKPKYTKGQKVNYIPKLSGLNPNKKLEIDSVNYRKGDSLTKAGWYYGFKGMNLGAHENDIKLSESVNESVSVFDERHYGKKGIIIMIDDGGKKVSAIFKDKRNADKYNRNKPEDVKKLLDLAKKTPYPKAIDESANESANQLNVGDVINEKMSTYRGLEGKTVKNTIIRKDNTVVIYFKDGTELEFSNDGVASILGESINEFTNQSVNEGKFYAFYDRKKYEIEASSLLDAKQKAIKQLKVPKSKVGLLSIVNADSHDKGSFRFN